jgi:serine/threonine protein kinase
MTERDIFLALLDLPDPAARAAYLDGACGGDNALRARVEALLQAHDTAGSFLEIPAVAPPDPNVAATREVDRKALTDGRANPDEALTFLTPSGRPDSLGRLGHYEVLEVLGRGGFGIVFRAFDEVLQRVVAVKVLAPQLAATSPARKRFLREARSSAQVRHENVVQVHAVEEQPLPYLVMEFIPGETLQQRLDRTGPLETLETLQIGRQIAEGLAAAHSTGLIHRDIKPGNILIEAGPHQHVKITDFGLARAADDASLTQSGVVAGTPMFMAPEQAKGEYIDHRADLFSLGSVLYTMTSGRPPFRAPNTLAVLKRVAEEAPRPIPEIIPEVPPWLCDLIRKLHAKKPEDRFASAKDVADLLARCQAELQQHGRVRSLASGTPTPSPTPSAVRQTPRKRLRAAVAAVLLLGLIGLGITEATGVTNVRGTVVRLFSPEGTLVVEVDDPAVSVTIDGEDVVITGAGAKEIRLKPGPYTVQVAKDGKVVRQELVTVTRNGRRVVRVRREAAPVPKASRWEKSLAALPAEKRVLAVVARLKKLNPGFDGTIEPTVADNRVIRFAVSGSGLQDLSPVRALPGLQALIARTPTPKLTTLAPLRGMQLTELVLHQTAVSDLSPLQGMKLNHLDCTCWKKVTDLSPLKGMPLKMLSIPYTRVRNLSPLKAMKLEWLNCDWTGVSDLSPLAGLPLRVLHVGHTRVSDLKPLTGLPLTYLDYTNTRVSDISPLKGMRLREVRCDFQPGRDAVILRSIRTLETINGKPATEFWKEVDKK